MTRFSLSGLTNLRTLFLSENPITSISSLSGFTRLTELYAYSCRINDVSALNRLTNLRTLMLLTQAQINDLKAALPNCDITF